MKLIGMKLKGIGPYKDEFSIDFAALSRSHMYLIEGETGAGKTTILDCITYALYGGPSVDGSDKTRLRSRFLGLRNERSYVDLIFELNGRYYRVRREPEYQYAKRNGDGTSTHTAKANLWRIDEKIAALAAAIEPDGAAERYFTFAEGEGNGTSLAAKASDVGAEIGQLIGLNRSQFSKTIMLAQGQFSDFLRMKPDERTNLVEELFSAQEYRRIQQILDDMRRERGHEVAGLRERLTDRIRQAQRNADRLAQMHGEPSDDATASRDHPASHDDAAPSGSDITTSSGHGADGTVGHGPGSDITASPLSDPWFWGLDDSGSIAEPAHTSEAVVGQLDHAVERVKAQATDMVRSARRDMDAVEEEAKERERHRDHVRELKDRADDERRLVRERLDLAERRDAIESNRNRIERSTKAEPVLSKQHDLERRMQERASVREDLRHTKEQLDGFPSHDELEEQERAALQAAGTEESARRKLELAQSHQTLLDKSEAAAKTLHDAEQRFEDSREDVERRKHALEELPDADELEQRLTRLVERLAGRELLETKRRQAENELDHARKAADLESEITRQQGKADEARVLSESAGHAYDEANRVFAMLGAARYAGDLEDGRPCPVCGSTDHPHPYAPPENTPTAKDVETLHKESRRRERELNDALQELATSRTRLKSEREQSGGKTPEQARRSVEEIEAQLAELDEIAGQRETAEQQQTAIRQAKDALDQAQRRYAQAEAELRHAHEAHDAATADADGHTRESVDHERSEAKEQLEEARQQARNAERLASTIKQRQRLETQRTEYASRESTLSTQIDELEQAIGDMLKERGFTDIDQAKECSLTAAETERLQREGEEYGQLVAANAARMEDARRDLASSIVIGGVSELEGAGTPDPSGAAPVACNDDGSLTVWGGRIADIDMDALDDACADAAERRDAARTRFNAVTQLDHERDRCAADLIEAAEAWDKAMRAYEPVRTMAMLANGGKDSPSERKLTLITYAVTERFRDVLMRANEILKDIQGGVYELRLGEHEGRGGTKVGLPIDVFDRRNEQLRPPSSLSGGETFFVSLALALALADIIQAENGGLSMETLFIDEGFGTLSEDYLDDVMAVLRGIAKTRDIGIISHVGQLKDQIAERISVRRDGPEGESRLTVVV